MCLGLITSDSRVLESQYTSKQEQKSKKQHVPKSVLKNQTLSVVNQDEFKSALTALRADSDPTDWLILTYNSKNNLELLAKGENGVTEMSSHFDSKNVYYGLFRTSRSLSFSLSLSLEKNTLKHVLSTRITSVKSWN